MTDTAHALPADLAAPDLLAPETEESSQTPAPVTPSIPEPQMPEPPIPVEVTVVETDRGEVWELAPDPLDAASRVLLREVAAWAAEWAPQGRARLVVDVPPAVASASGFLDPRGMRMLPTVQRVSSDEAPAEEMLTVWSAVVASGGAVGFRRDAGPEQIRPVLERQLAATADGSAVLVTTRGTAGDLLGFGWWELVRSPLLAHVAHLSRFQVRPDARGRNLGRIQLAGMHRIARELPGVEMCELAYRSGTGVSRLYDKCGYVEVGRRPGAVRAAPGDDRDSVLMMRRVDGGELRYDSGR